MNFDQFNAVPDSALRDLTDKTINPDGSARMATPGKTGNTDDVFNTGSHTEATGGNTAASGSGPAPNQPNGQTSAGKLLGDKGAKFAIDLMNALIPAVLYMLITRMGYENDKDQWKIEKEEREFVSPAVQAVLDKIMIDASNPYAQLAIVLGILYGGKFAVFMAEAKKKKKTEVKEQLQATIVEMKNIINKRPFEELYKDELLEAVKEYAAEKKMSFDKARGIMGRNQVKMKNIEKKAREKFEAQ